jgi:hypothetical protein
VPVAFVLPALDRRLATVDELGLHAATGRGRDDRRLAELGQWLTFAQDSLDVGPDFGLDSDGRKCGIAHRFNAWQTVLRSQFHRKSASAPSTHQ